MSAERLDKIIASRTSMSRKDVREAVKNGNVTVNGRVVSDSSVRADTDTDDITLFGKPFYEKKHVYIMMNKPQGVVSASESRDEKNVVDILPDKLKRPGLFPAGRLDKDTTGFVIITDDGDFAHRILAPKSHVGKVYEVTTELPVTEDDVKAFEIGLILGDGTKCMSAELTVISGNESVVMLKEGKYHQIKRMFASRGNKVVALHRTKIGGLSLDNSLDVGECRLLSDKEVNMIEYPENIGK